MKRENKNSLKRKLVAGAGKAGGLVTGVGMAIALSVNYGIENGDIDKEDIYDLFRPRVVEASRNEGDVEHNIVRITSSVPMEPDAYFSQEAEAKPTQLAFNDVPNVTDSRTHDLAKRKYILPESERTEDSINRIRDAMFLEGRGPEYYEMVGSTVINRSIDSGKSVAEILGAKKQYSFTNKNDPQKEISTSVEEYAKTNPIEWAAFLKADEAAREIVEYGTDMHFNHFYVRPVGSKKHPNWAKGRKPDRVYNHKGYFKKEVQDLVTRAFYIPRGE